jgi:hypothetical protein
MNYNQNEKIAQITSQTLIIGVDIAKFKHVARAQDYRGMEFGSPCYFDNTKQGFQLFLDWINQLKLEQHMEKVIVGMEPTGHYWLNLAHIAGLSLKENTSGKHKGQTKITKRGRKKLRALLFRVCMIIVAKNSAFKALHAYYTQRPDNPLKKMQSLIALCNKLIRIFFAIGKKQFEFSEERMLQDIPHMRANIEVEKAA